MTEKLFYKNAYIKEFDTVALRQAQDEHGNWFIVLAETAFYPTGGGQPHDMGMINGVQVVSVEEIDGELRHTLEQQIEQADQIHGVVNWERRFDHMQQHCGQHILTAAFVELFQLPTVSFHLGVETCTIDLQTESMTEEILDKVEKRANEVIRENRPVETKWVTEGEALKYDLRKELTVADNIRLVIIPEFDYNGCGGTHPDSTAQVGSVKILGWEKQRNQIRIEFVCGERVLKQLHRKHGIIKELSRLLSSSEEQMSSSALQLLANNKILTKKVAELGEELLTYEAQKYFHEAVDWHGEQVVSSVFQNRSIKELQKLAKIMTSENRGMNLFLVTENGHQLQFVFARDSLAGMNMKKIVKEVLPLVNGKGGGSEHTAQGGGEKLLSGQELVEEIFKLARIIK